MSDDLKTDDWIGREHHRAGRAFVPAKKSKRGKVDKLGKAPPELPEFRRCVGRERKTPGYPIRCPVIFKN
ncbi:MAG: hypothetical protein COX19_13105 [Desulfobacterales bacterium CG23_combo_of_CG06-09_8_20_14_all_51_8]|nr:MAG: hypothetical protein COX19_13105 [Desulfobacterales bacterium CG23_combo_of_CG06-09_8_20_14_all_51_8]